MAYNDRIVIEQRTDARDDYGEMDPTWSTYKTLWAEVDDTGGALDYASEQPVYTGTVTFRIHAHDAPSVTTKMRISYDSSYYSILSIQKEGRLHKVLTAEVYDDE